MVCMQWGEFWKAILFGIVEGITEWLPVSSTGHIILLEAICPLRISAEFYDLFEIVIQLGAIFAVIVLFFRKLNPFTGRKSSEQRRQTWQLWLKVIMAVLPSAVLGLLLDGPLDRALRNNRVLGVEWNVLVVASALILYGAAFLLVERRGRKPRVRETAQIDYRTALWIGAFQCLSIIPGTSRSGATILGAILLGVSRTAGAEFSFFLAIPTMLGAGGLKLVQFLTEGHTPTAGELTVLTAGSVVSFLVSLVVIRGLMDYVRRHRFRVFGIYRILLGIVVLMFFLLTGTER